MDKIQHIFITPLHNIIRLIRVMQTVQNAKVYNINIISKNIDYLFLFLSIIFYIAIPTNIITILKNNYKKYLNLKKKEVRIHF